MATAHRRRLRLVVDVKRRVLLCEALPVGVLLLPLGFLSRLESCLCGGAEDRINIFFVFETNF